MVSVAVVQLAEHCFQLTVSCPTQTRLFVAEGQTSWVMVIIVAWVMVVVTMVTIVVIIVVS